MICLCGWIALAVADPEHSAADGGVAAAAGDATPYADVGLTAKIFGNTAMAGTPIATQTLMSGNFSHMSAIPFSALVTGTITFPSSGASVLFKLGWPVCQYVCSVVLPRLFVGLTSLYMFGKQRGCLVV